jgi:hypothetical protein
MNDMPQQRLEQRPEPMQASTPVSATLTAQEWNVVFSALNELPMRMARPVWDRLMSQINPQG